MSHKAAPPRADRDLGFGLLAAVLALVPRLWVAIAWASAPVWDGHYYDFGARRIAAGLGYSDDVIISGAARWHPWCHYPVGYSGFLAGVYKLFGDGPRTATIANAVLGALIVVLTHQVALHFLPRWRARAAAVLCAIHPAMILYSAVVMTELLATLLPLLAMWLALREREHPWRSAILAGVVMGLATLVSPPAILLAPALGLVLVAVRRPWRTALAQAAGRALLVCAVALAVVAPWTVRNCRVMDGCAFVSTNGGWNLAIGAFSRATGRFETLRASDGCEVVTGQVQQDRCWADHGWQSIRRDPLRWLALAPRKLDFSFNHESFPVEYLKTADPGSWPEERRVWWRQRLTAFHRVLMTLAAFGMLGVISRKAAREVLDRKRPWGPVALELGLWTVAAALSAWAWLDDTFPFWPLSLLIPLLALVPRPAGPRAGAVAFLLGWSILAFDLVHVVFFGEDRYHVPLVPLLCVLAAAVGRLPAREQPAAEARP
jgi:4-amino-4-deoxy-L-arabinose transferase-like glycosyltransferase